MSQNAVSEETIAIICKVLANNIQHATISQILLFAVLFVKHGRRDYYVTPRSKRTNTP
jgi:hypothetical protein